jgi:hypothetical protein
MYFRFRPSKAKSIGNFLTNRQNAVKRVQEILAGIFKKSMGARNQGRIGISYRPARLHRLEELIPWNQFRDPAEELRMGIPMLRQYIDATM